MAIHAQILSAIFALMAAALWLAAAFVAKEIRRTAKEAIGKAIWVAARVSTVRFWRA